MLTSVTWTGGGDGHSWGDAYNWEAFKGIVDGTAIFENAVPGAGDTASVSSGTAVYSDSDATAFYFTSNGPLIVTAGTFTAVGISAPSVTVSDGAELNTGSPGVLYGLYVTGDFTNYGTFTQDSDGVETISVTGTLTNYGTIVATDESIAATSVVNEDGATIDNRNGGLAASFVENYGTIDMAWLSVTDESGSGDLTNHGTIVAQQSVGNGVLSVDGTLSNFGTIELDSVDGWISVNDGMLLNREDAVITLNNSDDGGINVEGTLSNGGTIEISVADGGHISVTGGTLLNAAGAVIDCQSVEGYGLTANTSNEGTVILSGGVLDINESEDSTYTFTNSGTISIADNAICNIRGQFLSDQGTITDAGILEFQFATAVFDADWSPAGPVVLAGSTVTVDGVLTNTSWLALVDSTLNADVANQGVLVVVGSTSDYATLSGDSTLDGRLTSNAGSRVVVGENADIYADCPFPLYDTELTDGSLAITGTTTVAGAVVVSSDSSLDVASLAVNGSGFLATDSTAQVHVRGSFLGNTTNLAQFSQSGVLWLDGQGTPDAPQLLELTQSDQGNVAAGYASGAAYGALRLGPNTYVKLVDQADNSSGDNSEAGYANRLVVPTGSTLDRNDLHLYAANDTTTAITTDHPMGSFDGEPIIISATVTSISGTPTGMVTFYDGTVLLGDGTLNNGEASFATSALTIGTHSLTAVYSGSEDFVESTSASLSHSVQAETTPGTSPIRVGAVFFEDSSTTDAPSTLSDTSVYVADLFEVGFTGGAAGTNLTKLTIDLDNTFFNTASGGGGAYGYFPLTILSHTGFDITSSSVTNGGTKLEMTFSGLDAGEELVFTIDVDEQGNAVAEGTEFEGATLTTTFTAPKMAEITSASVIFYDSFDFTDAALEDLLPNDAYNNAAATAYLGENASPGLIYTAGASGSLQQTPQLSSLSGTVFEDLNADNAQQADEPGIANVSLTLYALVEGNYIATGSTTSTDSDGNYEFEGLQLGTYRVVETQPAGYLSVGATAGTVDGVTRGIVTTVDILSNIRLDGGEDSIRNDFAETKPSSVSGYVYLDANNDGVMNQGEAGIGNVHVVVENTLTHATYDANTDSIGYWHVDSLMPGTYSIVETQPAGYLDGLDSVGTAGGTAGNPPPGDRIDGIVLGSEVSATGYCFGERPAPSAPTDISLSADVLAENQPAATLVGVFSSTDPDVDDTWTYSLVSGSGDDDNVAFTISDDGQLLSDVSFNYEAKSSYHIRVRSTDAASLWVEKQFTIAVTNVNETPTIETPATAVPNPVTDLTTNLSVSGADVDTGESSLTYTWEATTVPAGATPPTFTANGTNGAKSTTVAFSKAGTYIFTATIMDPGGQTATSTVSVVVNQTLTSIVVSPASATLNLGATQQFSATANDQFGDVLAVQPSFRWATTLGMISTSGILTAPTIAGAGTVTAASGTVNGSAVASCSSASGPVISGIVLAGTSDAITWNASDVDGLARSSLSIDGVALSSEPNLPV